MCKKWKVMMGVMALGLGLSVTLPSSAAVDDTEIQTMHTSTGGMSTRNTETPFGKKIQNKEAMKDKEIPKSEEEWNAIEDELDSEEHLILRKRERMPDGNILTTELYEMVIQ